MQERAKFDPRRTIRYFYLRFLRLRGCPRELARGVAMGVFVGITPTIPLHTVLVLLFTMIGRGSKIAGLLASVAVSNPLTFVPQYYFSWYLGTHLTPYDQSWERIRDTLTLLLAPETGFREALSTVGSLGSETIVTMVVGGSVLALPFTVAAYFLAFRFFLMLQEKRERRRQASEQP